MIDRLKRAWAKRVDDDGRFNAEIAPEVIDVDAPRDLDVDVGLFGENMLEDAARLGVRLREGGTRTARLTAAELDALGWGELQRELSEIAQHEVQIVIVQDQRLARRLGLNIPLRRR